MGAEPQGPARSHAARPAVTVAVVSWNTRDLLRDCLESMKDDVDDGLIEVHVYDNASEDGSAEMVAERFPWARLTRGAENLGYGTAVNRVAAESQAEWIAPANADIRLTNGAIRELLAASKADPQAGILAPRLELPDGSTQDSLGAFHTTRRALLEFIQAPRLSRRVRLTLNPALDLQSGRRVDWVAGAFLLVRGAAYRECGGFDESQWMYAEDVDLSWRLARNGWATRYVPQACVRHEHSAAADKAFGRANIEAREQKAMWEWSVMRRGRLRTGAAAVVIFADGWLRVAVGAVLKSNGQADRRRLMVFGRRGLRAVLRRPGGDG